MEERENYTIEGDSPIIIGGHLPSLGDNLNLSNLPQLLYERHCKYTYISNDIWFHNIETYKFVWESNPFVKGRTDDPANITPIGCPTHGLWYPTFHQNYFGFPDAPTYGKIWYEPKKIDVPENSVLIEISSRGYGLHLDNCRPVIENAIDNKYNSDFNFIGIRYNEPDNTVHRVLNDKEDIQIYTISTVFDFCDLLNSVENYVGFNSGSMAIAASIKEYYNNDLNIDCFNFRQIDMDGQNWNPPNANIILI
tara:strand:+ start:566 stop:1318 length:753 start_codon:yes stop_codon:yes gene_type:complete